MHATNASNDVCTLSNYDDLDDTITYCSGVTAGNFSLRIGKIINSVLMLFKDASALVSTNLGICVSYVTFKVA